MLLGATIHKLIRLARQTKTYSLQDAINRPAPHTSIFNVVLHAIIPLLAIDSLTRSEGYDGEKTILVDIPMTIDKVYIE